mmetsp:Transcript_6998/g.20502  ORF Transcript_6998/g.20502 Transcript_6998/m.20502 type:complete len:84 (-) Transcript_6998:478-729(-)
MGTSLKPPHISLAWAKPWGIGEGQQLRCTSLAALETHRHAYTKAVQFMFSDPISAMLAGWFWATAIGPEMQRDGTIHRQRVRW